MPHKKVHVRDHDRRKPHQELYVHVVDYDRHQEVTRGVPAGYSELGPMTNGEPACYCGKPGTVWNSAKRRWTCLEHSDSEKIRTAALEREDFVVTSIETGKMTKVRAPAHDFVTLRLKVETDEGSLCEDKSIQVLRSQMKTLDLTSWLEEAVEESAENLHSGGSDSETARGRIDLSGVDPATGEYTWEPVEELEVRTEDY